MATNGKTILGAVVGVAFVGALFAQIMPITASTPDTSVAACISANGTDPAESFPCTGGTPSRVLLMPVCTAGERRAMALAWSEGHARPAQCTSEQ